MPSLGVTVLLVAFALVGAQPQVRPVDTLELACEDKNKGDQCKAILGHGNRTIEGLCYGGGPENSTNGPPLHCRMSHPGELACKGKSESDKCSWKHPGDKSGNENSGTCNKTPHGSLMCRMVDPVPERSSPDGPDADGILPPHLACEKLKEGDECKTHGPGKTGICSPITGSQSELHCRHVMPAELACTGKKENDDCEFQRPGPGDAEEKESGACIKLGRHGEDDLVCRPNNRNGARLSQLTPVQQAELQQKETRLREIRGQHNFRSDDKLYDEYKKLKSSVRGIRRGSTSAAEAQIGTLRRLRSSKH